jgi:hypothetical protein
MSKLIEFDVLTQYPMIGDRDKTQLVILEGFSSLEDWCEGGDPVCWPLRETALHAARVSNGRLVVDLEPSQDEFGMLRTTVIHFCEADFLKMVQMAASLGWGKRRHLTRAEREAYLAEGTPLEDNHE